MCREKTKYLESFFKFEFEPILFSQLIVSDFQNAHICSKMRVLELFNSMHIFFNSELEIETKDYERTW